MGVNGAQTFLRNIRHKVSQTLRLFRELLVPGMNTFFTAHGYCLLVLTIFFLVVQFVFPVGVDKWLHGECQWM